eukprot:m.362328 g.362328  ORF g.362328 m.362328 type:complete len:159 (+) comp20341_c0_seq1:148-624(+)
MATPSQTAVVASLASQLKVVPYSTLMSELGLESVRDMEDVVIAAIYEGAVGGKLNPRDQQFLVEFSTLSDITTDSVTGMTSVMQKWNAKLQSTLKTLETNIADAESKHNAKLKTEADFQTEFANAKEAEASTASGIAKGSAVDAVRKMDRARMMKGPM